MLRRSFLLAGAGLPFVSALAAAQGSGQALTVLYAGSLVTLMEGSVGPAFDAAGDATFRGYAGGSNKLGNEIKGRLRRGDVFISASPKVNEALSGPANGDWVSWFVTFARSPLVIAYPPSSRIASAFAAKPWHEVLQSPGIRIGRTDPVLDPKGRFTVELMDKAAGFYHQPDLAHTVLGAPDNPAQVFPEETLVGRLQSGQLDVGFMYSTEVTDLHLPAITLPPELALGAQYTVTVLRDAPNPAGAERFVQFLLGPRGSALMREHGLDVVRPTIGGDPAAVPLSIRAMLVAAR